jgi:hypothetical protein
MRQRYTKHVGEKFHEDAKARAFAGSSIICLVPANSDSMRVLQRLHDDIDSQPWHTRFAMLPPSSYHMTLFDLVCDQVRTPEYWTSALPLDAPLAEVDAFMEECWSDLPPAPMPAVRVDSLTIGDYITIHLLPENSQAELQLRTYRNLLAEVFGIRHPGHDTYAFHITLAYAITRLTGRELKQAQSACEAWNVALVRQMEAPELLPPRLTFFADMTHFAPSRELARRNVIL